MSLEYTYTEQKEDDLRLLALISPENGYQVQARLLEDTDESQLTELERLFMVLSAISYEVDHDMLTDELRGELGWYYDALHDGILDDILDRDKEADAIADIEKYFAIVYGEE